jgi:serine/threonine protein kinase
VLIYEMVLGYPPFYDTSPIKIYQKIVDGRIHFPPFVHPDAKDIVQKLCTRDLSSRLGNTSGGGWKVMEHPFFKGIDWEEVEQRKGLVSNTLSFSGDKGGDEEVKGIKG